jgi:long-chain acyl-CoA synthetase
LNLATWLVRAACEFQSKDALYLGVDPVARYDQFGHWATSGASWLRSRGIQAGDRVAIYMPNTPDYLALFYAIWHLGAVAVPVNAKLHAKEAAWVFENAGARLAFVGKNAAQELEQSLGPNSQTEILVLPKVGFGGIAHGFDPSPVASRDADDLAWLFYTSGTTGRPKGVEITHGMMQSMALSYFVDVDHVFDSDVALYAAPMSHGAGLYNLMHVMKGAGHVCPVSGGFDPEEIFALGAHFGAVHMFAAPTMIKRLTQQAVQREEPPTGLRTIVYGGGPMYMADIEEAVDVFGDIFVQIYGQGECPMAISALSRKDVADRTHPRWKERLASVGKAQSVVEVEIADPNGRPLPIGEVGEIMVRGAPVMKAYWKNPEATQKSIVNGWLMTGDMGVIDHDGYITLKDRSKDLIISGGSNIYPREVEEVLLLHKSISEVSVIGTPHPEWGEEVVAFIVLAGGETLNKPDLDAHCNAYIARFKRPKRYVVCEDLPKNNYGKILKTELRMQI